MGPITYTIIETNGRNVSINYACDGESVTVGADIQPGLSEEELNRVILSYTPMRYFNDKFNPTPIDALASLVGKTGEVILTMPPQTPPATPVEQPNALVIE